MEVFKFLEHLDERRNVEKADLRDEELCNLIDWKFDFLYVIVDNSSRSIFDWFEFLDFDKIEEQVRERLMYSEEGEILNLIEDTFHILIYYFFLFSEGRVYDTSDEVYEEVEEYFPLRNVEKIYSFE